MRSLWSTSGWSPDRRWSPAAPPERVHLVRFAGQTFFQTLRRKLKWGDLAERREDDQSCLPIGSSSSAALIFNASASRTMFTSATFLSPRSAPPTYVRSMPALAASFSCERPARWRCSRRVSPKRLRISARERARKTERSLIVNKVASRARCGS
jgi:hypothetical protein